MKFKTFREAYDAYLKIAMACPAGSDRDQAFLAMADVPVLATDNHGHKYPVCIVKEGEHQVLYCVGAPSGWRLTDLLKKPICPDVVALDFGQNWYWINAGNVLRAVLDKYIKDVTSIASVMHRSLAELPTESKAYLLDALCKKTLRGK